MIFKITNVSLFDGNDFFEQSAIAFDQENIIAVGAEAEQVNADEVIDGEGQTCLPGLIDCHVHLTMDGEADPFQRMAQETEADAALRGLNNAKKHIEAGITAVRNLGSKDNVDIAVRNAINEGIAEGPHISASGEPIVMTGGHGHMMAIEADGEDEVRKASRTQLKADADVLKLMATGGVMTKGVEPGSPQLSEKEMHAACEEAGHAGRTTAAHAQGVEGIKNAIRAGITSIEHGIFLDDEAIEMMIENGTFLVPTLAAPYHIVEKGLSAGIPEHAVQKSKDVMESHQNSFRKAYEAGVKIASGTDAGTPFNKHGDFFTEVRLMVESGMSIKDALRSSTVVASEALNVGQVTGSIEKGKWADLLFVNGNPLENLESLKEVHEVYKKGVRIYSSEK